MLRILGVALGAALLAACVSGRCCPSDSGIDVQRGWWPAQHPPPLRPTARVEIHTVRNVTPWLGEIHVVDGRGRRIQTLSALRRHVRPLVSLDDAYAYRSLLAKMEMQRDPHVQALSLSSFVKFHEGDRAWAGHYVAEQAEKWGIGKEHLVEEHPDAFVIMGPLFRWLEPLRGAGVVELVRETIYRDGRYKREVLRELERGRAAMVHRPWLLL